MRWIAIGRRWAYHLSRLQYCLQLSNFGKNVSEEYLRCLLINVLFILAYIHALFGSACRRIEACLLSHTKLLRALSCLYSYITSCQKFLPAHRNQYGRIRLNKSTYTVFEARNVAHMDQTTMRV
jgi:hypothetical protein